jgi:hypothetical protein
MTLTCTYRHRIKRATVLLLLTSLSTQSEPNNIMSRRVYRPGAYVDLGGGPARMGRPISSAPNNGRPPWELLMRLAPCTWPPFIGTPSSCIVLVVTTHSTLSISPGQRELTICYIYNVFLKFCCSYFMNETLHLIYGPWGVR